MDLLASLAAGGTAEQLLQLHWALMLLPATLWAGAVLGLFPEGDVLQPRLARISKKSGEILPLFSDSYLGDQISKFYSGGLICLPVRCSSEGVTGSPDLNALRISMRCMVL